MPNRSSVLTTPLHSFHIAHGARMVPFAGYSLPVQYEGIVAEHSHTRTQAALFDVSHMGQITVTGNSYFEVARALEAIIPADIVDLAPGDMRYSVLLNARGTIEDDLIIMRPPEKMAQPSAVILVVNAARKSHDYAYIRAAIGVEFNMRLAKNQALLALQGPRAAAVLNKYCDAASQLLFMQSGLFDVAGIPALISRSGYTGEDGFELSVAADKVADLAELLLAAEQVKLAGLGARDSLRLEAGLCLYGHDMDDKIDPVGANIWFAIGKNRRSSADFAGSDHVLKAHAHGPEFKRVGVRFDGRQPVREGAEIVDVNSNNLGRITSGTFSPSLNCPIAMAYLPPAACTIGAPVMALVRGKPVLGHVAKMPFIPHKYVRQRTNSSHQGD